MKEFKWGDFKDWDEIEDCGGFVTDKLSDMYSIASTGSAFTTRYEDDDLSSLFTVYWSDNSGEAVIDLHHGFVTAYDILQKDAISDIRNLIDRLEMAICSYEMTSQVDNLYQKKLKQNKKKPDYDDCYYQVSKKLCKDFHISSHENSGACRRGSSLVEKWCVNDHLKYDQKASA
jgi:hypothetical protein